MKQYRLCLPRYLDEPERFLCWTVDEAMVMLMPMVLGLLFHHSGLGLIVGLVSFASYHHTKNCTQGFYTVKGFFYWHGLLRSRRWRALPPSWVREVIG